MDVLKKWKMEYDKVFLPLMLDQQHEFVEDPGVHCFFQMLFHRFVSRKSSNRSVLTKCFEPCNTVGHPEIKVVS